MTGGSTAGGDAAQTSGSNYLGYRVVNRGSQGGHQHTDAKQKSVQGSRSAIESGGDGRGAAATQRQWTLTLPDGSVRSGTGDVPADVQTLLEAGQASVKGESHWSVTLPDGSQRTGVGEMPADLKSLLSARGGSGHVEGHGLSAQSGSAGDAAVRRRGRWNLTMPDGMVRTGSGDTPSDLTSLAGASGKRSWSMRMPDGSLRTGEGEMPADLQAMTNAGTSGRTKRRWSVVMPDGTPRTGVGEMPADLLALTSGSSGGGQVKRSWQVTMPDGTIRSGSGEIPADIRALMPSSSNPGSGSRYDYMNYYLFVYACTILE